MILEDKGCTILVRVVGAIVQLIHKDHSSTSFQAMEKMDSNGEIPNFEDVERWRGLKYFEKR